VGGYCSRRGKVHRRGMPHAADDDGACGLTTRARVLPCLPVASCSRPGSRPLCSNDAQQAKRRPAQRGPVRGALTGAASAGPAEATRPCCRLWSSRSRVVSNAPRNSTLCLAPLSVLAMPARSASRPAPFRCAGLAPPAAFLWRILKCIAPHPAESGGLGSVKRVCESGWRAMTSRTFLLPSERKRNRSGALSCLSGPSPVRGIAGQACSLLVPDR